MISEIVATYRIKKVDEFCKNGQYTEALEEAWKIPETSSELEISKKLLIGTIYYYLKNYDDALSYLDSIRDCEEEDIIGVIHAYLGCVYQKMGLYEAGLKNIERGLQEGYSEEEEKDSTCFVCKGECHFHLGQYELALEAYREAIGYVQYGDEYTIPEIEEKIKAVKYVQAQDETEKEAKKRPTHITIQGNNTAPINIGGILATDDAIINRATILKEEEEVITAFCPQCGCKVDAEDRFCRSCGGKLR